MMSDKSTIDSMQQAITKLEKLVEAQGKQIKTLIAANRKMEQVIHKQVLSLRNKIHTLDNSTSSELSRLQSKLNK